MDRLSYWVSRARRLDLRAYFLTTAAALTAVLALNALFYVFLTRPRLELAAGSRDVFVRTDLELQKERAALQAAQDDLSRLRCIHADLDRFKTEVLSSKVARMTRVQKTLRELARLFKMDPERISYNFRDVEDADLIGFDITFPLEGSYEDLRQFLHHLETSDQFLLVEQIVLSGSRSGGASLSLNIHLSTYFAGFEAATPVAEAPSEPQGEDA